MILNDLNMDFIPLCKFFVEKYEIEGHTRKETTDIDKLIEIKSLN